MKRLLVTSTVAGEGKTFLAINLALVFAELGEKVLLIDGDMRRPRLHKLFDLSPEKGLSTFLAHAKDCGAIGGLVRDTDNPGLKVLPCGPLPANPMELLNSPHLKTLLLWAKEGYDRVIIDGTPLLPISDALLWGREADAAVFVVKFGGVNAHMARKVCRTLREASLTIVGAVINQVAVRDGYYGYYYSQYKYRSPEVGGHEKS